MLPLDIACIGRDSLRQPIIVLLIMPDRANPPQQIRLLLPLVDAGVAHC